MAISDVTDLQSFLGKTISLRLAWEGRFSEHQGRVIAVVSVLPGSPMEPALMLDEGEGRREYFHLGDITISNVQ